MAGCFGNDPYDKYVERKLFAYLKESEVDEKRDEMIEQRTKDKFMALPDFYTCRDGTRRWTNIDDAAGSLKQEEWIAIARCLRDGDNLEAGNLLSLALWRVLGNEAESEIDDESDLEAI